jgi:hypothetical protein
LLAKAYPFEVVMQRLMPLALADGVALRLIPLFTEVNLQAALPSR